MIEFEEQPQLDYDGIERTWRRTFKLSNISPMLQHRSKHKLFQPETFTIEFVRHNDAPPVIRKVVFKGPFVNVEGTGMRVFNAADIDDPMLDPIREKIEIIVEQIAGVPSRNSIFAKMARRAEGWKTEPFTPAEEKLWQAYEKFRGAA